MTSDAPSIRLSARKNSKSRSDFEFFRVRCFGSWSPVPPGEGPWEAWEGLGRHETQFSSLKLFGLKSRQVFATPRNRPSRIRWSTPQDLGGPKMTVSRLVKKRISPISIIRRRFESSRRDLKDARIHHPARWNARSVSRGQDFLKIWSGKPCKPMII